ncbi:MAG: outer membrane beta-barrel protein [Bacteroidota bacterium]|nr:outer membrane beta-barrel protein [Bacteroidota bacterium]
MTSINNDKKNYTNTCKSQISIKVVIIRIFILIGFFSHIFTFSSAQTKFGINLGINSSTIRYADETKENLIAPYRKLKPGLSAGLSVKTTLNPLLFINSELNYSRKGLKYLQDGIRKGSNKTNYIQWTATGNIIGLKHKKHKLFTGIGLYTAFLINGKYDSVNLQTGETRSEPFDFKNNNYTYNRWDAGLTIRLGYFNKKSPVHFSGSYEHGMLQSSQEIVDSYSNRTIRLELSYMLKK